MGDSPQESEPRAITPPRPRRVTLPRNETLLLSDRGVGYLCGATIASVRDARPFLSFHLRQRAWERADRNGADLHRLARWIENLPARNPDMARIEATPALGYDDGSFIAGDEAEELISSYVLGPDIESRKRWLNGFADAVARFWSRP